MTSEFTLPRYCPYHVQMARPVLLTTIYRKVSHHVYATYTNYEVVTRHTILACISAWVLINLGSALPPELIQDQHLLKTHLAYI